MGTSRSFRWIFASIGVLALAGFVLAAVSLFLNAASFAAIGQGPRTSAPAPVRWSAIESDDKATYMANLRAIGCPEPTIAAIVNARATDQNSEVAGHTAQAPTAAPALSQSTSLSNVTSSFVSAPQSISPVVTDAAEPSAPVLTSSFTGVVAQPALTTHSSGASVPQRSASSPVRNAGGRSVAAAVPLGRAGATSVPLAAPAGPAAASDESAVAEEQVITAPNDAVAIPVAFQAGQDAELNDAQKAQQDALQQQFVNNIGGVNQDPSNPAYLAAWQKAQRQADERYMALFGQQAFLDRQNWANQHPEADRKLD